MRRRRGAIGRIPGVTAGNSVVFTRRMTQNTAVSCAAVYGGGVRGMSMITMGLGGFDASIQNANVWFDELMDEMGWKDRYKGYLALRKTLHALRDRLSIKRATRLGSELPMLIRGLYYEGWDPAGNPPRPMEKNEYLDAIRDYFNDDPNVDPERLTRAVFRMICKAVSPNETGSMENVLPEELREYWP